MKKKTIDIWEDDHATWVRWKKKYGFNNPEMFHFLVEGISREARKKRYSEMPVHTNYKKPLSGCKIKNKERFIKK